ncbi:hypothetical protein BDV96DRAFT_108258 [Lophiotrema nucula]|uniref:Transcription factor RfeG n=1 Tax=Lophiotrema nucula TaxID=690887 RepID=A0A6A5Z6R1_9PLEO|nr:hypothetical protein BDV96DRAFT_108258 [Lophiotrema nucula]
MSRANQWFVPGDGIAREVITADIQRYLGPDALVRPGPGSGEFEGRSGYWITAYRTLTSQMIQDLKMDSLRWENERRQEGGRRGAYQDSETHASRQHWGPTEPYSQSAREPSRQTYAASTPSYAGSEHSHSAYTTTPAASTYGSQHAAYASPSVAAQPRTQPAPYGYSQPGARDQPTYATPSPYATGGYSQQQTHDPYRPPPPTQHYSTPSSTAAAPGYYIASDGRQYPIAQQPQQRRK